jgi:hypothetical protein
VSLGLAAPAAVEVEVRTEERRAFRLTRQVGPGGLELDLPAPFEIGRPVQVTFRLPDDQPLPVISVRAEVDLLGEEAERRGEAGGCLLRFVDPSVDIRNRILAYVTQRLGLPSMAF